MLVPLHEIFLRLTVAAVLGATIGVERDVRRRPAGVRTSMFVCLATALFTILSGEIARILGDSGSTRIASNIVQGIGFLGAGAILRESGAIVGMTTAATVFVEAAIGMASGGGFFAIAGYSTGLVLFSLIVLGAVEKWFHLKPRMMVFRVTTGHADSLAGEVQRLLSGMNVKFDHFRVSMSGTNSIVEFEADVSHAQQEQIVEQLNRAGVVTEVIPVQERPE